MVNTGTWNSDLAFIFVIMFFLPIFLYMIMGVVLRAKEFSEKTYVIEVYQKAPKPKKVKTKTRQKPKPRKTKKPASVWENGMVSEAVQALVRLGYKKSQSRMIVSRLCAEKNYKKTEDIIIDAMKCV